MIRRKERQQAVSTNIRAKGQLNKYIPSRTLIWAGLYLLVTFCKLLNIPMMTTMLTLSLSQMKFGRRGLFNADFSHRASLQSARASW